MIVTVGQLKAIHYCYFAIGMFSLTSAFLLGIGSPFSLIFLAFYATNSGISWYIAAVARRRMRKVLVVNDVRFFLNHLLLTLLSVAFTVLLWVSGLFPDVTLLNALLLSNYYFLFLAGIWYMVTRTDISKDLFRVYDSYLFGKSKEFMMRTRRARWRFYGTRLVPEEDLKGYEYGNIRDVDDNLLSAWRFRKKVRYVLECMGRIELSLARKRLQDLKDRIDELRLYPKGPENYKLIRSSEQERSRMERDIANYEKELYRKAEEDQVKA